MPNRSVGYRLLVDGQEHVVSLRLSKKGKVVLSDKECFKKECSLEEFDGLTGKHSIVVNHRGEIAFLGYFYTGLGILYIFLSVPKAFRDSRLLSMIADKEEA